MWIICNNCKKERTLDGNEKHRFSIPMCGECSIKTNRVFITPFDYIGNRIIAAHLFKCPACGYDQIIHNFKFCPVCGKQLTFNLYVLEDNIKEI